MAEEAAQTDEKVENPQKKGGANGASTRKFTLTAAGLAAVLAAMPGVITAFKGEPFAQDTWMTLKTKVDEQSRVINQLKTRMVYFQAQQEAETAMKLYNKLEALQKKYDALVAKGAKPTVETLRGDAQKPKPIAKKPPQCSERRVLGEDGKCHWVKKTVAVKVKKAEADKAEIQKRLHEEKMRRLALERKKYEMSKKFKAAHQVQAAPLAPLPDKPGK